MASPLPNVHETVWPWRRSAGAASASHGAQPGKLAAQAAFGLVVAGGLRWAGAQWQNPHLARASVVALCATVVMFVLGLALPKVHAAIVGGLLRFVHAVGVFLSAVLLPVVFFLVFLPVGLLRRAMGNDSMGRQWPPPAGSLWQTRRAVASAEEYRRQF